MGVQEKVSAQHFTLKTGLSEAEIREAAGRAAQAGKRPMTSAVEQRSSGANSLSYVIKGPGGFKDLMVFQLSWTPVGDGGHQVSLQTGNYLTRQEKLLMFIPVGPKTVPALGSLKRFSEWMRKELTAKVPA